MNEGISKVQFSCLLHKKVKTSNHLRALKDEKIQDAFIERIDLKAKHAP